MKSTSAVLGVVFGLALVAFAASTYHRIILNLLQRPANLPSYHARRAGAGGHCFTAYNHADTMSVIRAGVNASYSTLTR
jgi:hypothetical protein